MARQCSNCGAVYENDEATYCNACGSESLHPVFTPATTASTPAPMREDPFSLTVAGVLWLSGLTYILGHRQPKTWASLLFAWALLATAGAVAGLVLKNTRLFSYFSGFGAIFMLVYAAVKWSP
ncbi:MAG: hypothetical protein AAFN74_13200 [Myxococcota bacterium]